MRLVTCETLSPCAQAEPRLPTFEVAMLISAEESQVREKYSILKRPIFRRGMPVSPTLVTVKVREKVIQRLNAQYSKSTPVAPTLSITVKVEYSHYRRESRHLKCRPVAPTSFRKEILGLYMRK